MSGKSLGIGFAADDDVAGAVECDALRGVGQFAAEQGSGQDVRQGGVPLDYESVRVSARGNLVGQIGDGGLGRGLKRSRRGGEDELWGRAAAIVWHEGAGSVEVGVGVEG